MGTDCTTEWPTKNNEARNCTINAYEMRGIGSN